MLGAVLDAGAEEVNDLGEAFEVVCEATDLVAVRTALQDAGIDYESAEASFVPSLQVPLDEEGARKIFRLIDALEDSDDVQNVFANFDVSDEVMAEVDAEPHRSSRAGDVARYGRAAWRCTGPVGAVPVALRTPVRTAAPRPRPAGGWRVRVLGVDPGLTRCGLGVVDGRAGPAAARWSRVGVVRTPADADLGTRLRRRRARRSRRGSTRTGPTRRRRAGVQPAQRAHRDGHRPGQRGRHRCAAARAGSPSPCTPRARSRPPSPATAAPTRPRSARW